MCNQHTMSELPQWLLDNLEQAWCESNTKCATALGIHIHCGHGADGNQSDPLTERKQRG